MSPYAYLWLRVVHIIGFVLWSAGLVAGIGLLRAYVKANAEARPSLVPLLKKTGALMDAGATFAIGAGLWRAFGGPVNAFKTGGWLHAKLAVVVLGVLSVHGLVRAKMRKYREGNVQPLPNWVMPMLLVALGIIIVLGAHPMMLRK